MAHCNQAWKRARQGEKRRINNKSVRNEIKTLKKDLEEKVAAKDSAAAQVLFKAVVAKIDKAAKKHIFHKNNAARQKSHMAVLLNSLKAS